MNNYAEASAKLFTLVNGKGTMIRTREPNWRDADSLHDLNFSQALQILGAISEHFGHPTGGDQQRSHDEKFAELIEDSRFAAMDASQEAQQFADAANSLGRRLRSAKDCRPQLRQQADEKRSLDPAVEFAENCRALHRK